MPKFTLETSVPFTRNGESVVAAVVTQQEPDFHGFTASNALRILVGIFPDWSAKGALFLRGTCKESDGRAFFIPAEQLNLVCDAVVEAAGVFARDCCPPDSSCDFPDCALIKAGVALRGDQPNANPVAVRPETKPAGAQTHKEPALTEKRPPPAPPEPAKPVRDPDSCPPDDPFPGWTDGDLEAEQYRRAAAVRRAAAPYEAALLAEQDCLDARRARLAELPNRRKKMR